MSLVSKLLYIFQNSSQSRIFETRDLNKSMTPVHDGNRGADRGDSILRFGNFCLIDLQWNLTKNDLM